MSKPNQRIVIGLHSSREVIRVRPKKITEIWLKQGADKLHDFKEFIEFGKKQNLRVLFKPDGELSKIATSHQGVCLYVSETPEFDLESLDSESVEPAILVALDEISDPHNIGAVLRTAWLMGAKALILPDMRSGKLTPAATKVASGGAEHVPIVITGNLQIELTRLKDKGFWVYGLAAEGSAPIQKTKFHEKVVLVVGAEDKGMRSTTRNACDQLVAIPQTNKAASFNASVAAAIALYEICRQHQAVETP